jgi:hypothetical protein
MRRREFISLIGGAAAAWPLTARAQQPAKVPRVGLLTPAETDTTPIFDGFRRGLRDLSYIEGTLTKDISDWQRDSEQDCDMREYGRSKCDQRTKAIHLIELALDGLL